MGKLQKAPTMGGAGLTGEQSASYIIFKDGTTIKAKNGSTGGIDFSGTDAATVIQNTLDALTNGRTWKEKVVLKGDFVINNSIGIPSYTILEIRGRLKAKNNCAISAGTGMLQNSGFWADPNTEMEIIGGEIDGNKANNTTDFEGIFLSQVNNFLIRDVTVHDSPEVGIALYPSQTDGLMDGEIRNANVYNNDADGLQLELAIEAAKGARIRIIGGRYHDNPGNGISIKSQLTWTEPPLLEVSIINVETHNNSNGIAISWISDRLKKISIQNCYTHSNELNGIWLQTVDYGVISGNIAENNGYSGIEVWASNYVSITNNVAINNRQGTAGYPNQEAGISVYDSSNIVVANNICSDDQETTTQTYGVRLLQSVPQENVRIIANDLLNNVNPIGIAGTWTNLTIWGNMGYVTEASGTATIANGENSIVVAHGLAATPTSIHPTGQHSEVASLYVDTIGAENFTIHAADGNVTANRDVYWYAEVQ